MFTNSIIDQIFRHEIMRQRSGFELIPSENYVSRDILNALGSEFTNKYSEGFPGKRYYGGNENMDEIETLAIELACQLFGSDHANVQPLSGAPANNIVYHAWLEPGDTILAMRLDHGGHLTHGSPVTTSAKLYNFVHYGIGNLQTGELDFDQMLQLAKVHQPKIILAGHSGYPRNLDYQKFAEIAQAVNAVAMADVAHLAGLIAANVNDNPFDYGFQIVTSTTHKSLRGPRGGLILTKGTVSTPLKAPPKTVENLPTLIDREVFPGFQGGPHMNVILAKAIAFQEALQPSFRQYAQQVLDNAKQLADELMSRGFKLVTNGTDNHLMQIDMMQSLGIDGREAQDALDKIGLTANCNSIPNDTLPPYRPSGLRIGTPAITTRGLKSSDMAQIADWIQSGLDNRKDDQKLHQLKLQVSEFAMKFPLPSDTQN